MLAAVVTAGLRERKKEKTRQDLVRSALCQFAERGFEHVTVEEIAASCDVSPRTFFRYFGSKEDVLFADADAQRAHLMRVLAAQPPGVVPLRALEAAVLEIAGDYQDQREVFLLRHRVVCETPSLRSRVAERHHCWESAVTAELRRSGPGAGMPELTLRLSVASATTALRVATELWMEADAEGDLRALLTTALRTLGTGLEPAC